MQVVAKVAGTFAYPTRLEGNVSEKNGVVRIVYKVKGQVKLKTKILATNDPNLIAHMTGETGFAIVMTNAPIAQFFGDVTPSNEGIVIKTPDGEKVYFNSAAAGAVVDLEEADEDSREARMALRAAKVKGVKVRGSADEKPAKKASKDAPVKKKVKK